MLLLSIHPKYANLILSGTKQVELRRQKLRVDSGDALIYSTTPQKELVGRFRIASVVRAPLDLLWQLVGNVSGISRSDFDLYFAGLETGVAIQIADVVRFPTPISLAELRNSWNGFHPPQGFRYVECGEIALLGIDVACPAA